MITIHKDRKSDTWIITTTDGQGFHRQINVTADDMDSLIQQWTKILWQN